MSHLNKTNIEWVRNPDGTQGRTWNPVTGCLHNCPYCYARKIAIRLDAPAREKKPQRIFVGSMCDLLGDWVPLEWIEAVFKACEAAPWHRYYFLTKNPERYKDLYPKIYLYGKPNFWYGTTMTGREKIGMVGRLHQSWKQFVSYEPILDYNDGKIVYPTDWLIVGAQTNPDIMPERQWILDIREQCRDLKIPLFEKNSLAPLSLPGGLIQEVPE